MKKEDLLTLVTKPSRYIGGEINSIRKEHEKVKTKVALIFPDTYEIGISHLGLKILYQIINSRDDLLAERAYAPWLDMEEVLRLYSIPLSSHESSTPLSRFDILGFTIPYELTYTNILNILDLSGIPIRSSDRRKGYPLIIGGGSAVYNPEPMADFFDAIAVGDGEEVVVEIIDCYQKWKEGRGDKLKLIELLSEIEGVYVPSLYHIEYNNDGNIRSISPRGKAPERVTRRIVSSLDKAPFPIRHVIPYTRAVHDRLTVEITRGCTHGCRFCQAGITYRPVRERSPEIIEEIVERSIAATGYEEVSLASLSTGDYFSLSPLLKRLMNRFKDKRVSFSLPSLRVGTLSHDILKEIKKARKTGFTLAPEAGTERLRRVINKPISEEELLNTVADIYGEGWRSVKFYFMIGLPTEEILDLDGIIGLTERVLMIGRGFKGGRKRIRISLSTFVPKPHTPFQWIGQIPADEIVRRQGYLKSRLRKGDVDLQVQRPEISQLEALLSRGDRRIGRLIERAWKLGCRFDGWVETFSYEKWKKAFLESDTDPLFYAQRTIGVNDILPWDHIDTGVTKNFLLSELEGAHSLSITPDCRYGDCFNCGVCTDRNRLDVRPFIANIIKKEVVVDQSAHDHRLGFPDYFRVRLKYKKEGDLRHISQLEFMSSFFRAINRGGIPIAFSEGFHPHPKVSSGPALPCGMESSAEYMDMVLLSRIDPPLLVNILNKELPHGIRIMAARRLHSGAPSLSSVITGLAYMIDLGVPVSSVDAIIQDLLSKDEIRIKRVSKRGEQDIDIRPMLATVKLIGKKEIFMLLESKGEVHCRPQDVLQEIFSYHKGVPVPFTIKRIGQYIRRGDKWHDPIDFCTTNRSEREGVCL